MTTQPNEALVEEAGLAFARSFYGPNFDPHLNPEAYDMACEVTRAIIPIVQKAEREKVVAWIKTQRDDIPAHGWEFASAIENGAHDEGEG